MELGAYYLWIKALHIIFVIFWMAGLFMLPRYYAYHCECEPGSAEDARWLDREHKLLRIIVIPAMALAWLFGLWLAVGLGNFGAGWLQAKLLLVTGLTLFVLLLARWRRDFLPGGTRRTSRFFRMVNEIPGVTIIVVVLLVVLKPGFG